MEDTSLGIYGVSFLAQYMRDFARLWAMSKLHVLITGPTGSGKECFARAIARLQLKADYEKRFTIVNVAALNPNLLGSELFGYVKGAFTGAYQETPGYLHKANRGILCLDELAELEPHLQAYLLRVAQDGSFSKVGSTKEETAELCRLMAATNAPERLRPDIVSRFGLRIDVPPLRARRVDIFEILDRWLQRQGGPASGLQWRYDPEAIMMILFSPWHGNIRELLHGAQLSLDYWTAGTEKPDHLVLSVNKPSDQYPLLAQTELLVKAWNLIAATVKRAPSGVRLPVYKHWTEALSPSLGAVHLAREDVEGIFRTDDGRSWPELDTQAFLERHGLGVLLRLVNDGLPREAEEAKTSGPPDLTGYTEKDILALYWSQVRAASGGIKAQAARIAKVKAHAVDRRYRKFGLD